MKPQFAADGAAEEIRNAQMCAVFSRPVRQLFVTKCYRLFPREISKQLTAGQHRLCRFIVL